MSWARLCLTLLYSERPKLHRVLAILSAIGLMSLVKDLLNLQMHLNSNVLIVFAGKIRNSAVVQMPLTCFGLICLCYNVQ